MNPVDPAGVPQFHLLGDDSITAPLHESIDARLAGGVWRTDGAEGPDCLRLNLLRLLDRTDLPMPTDENKDEFNLECPICTCFKLEEVKRHDADDMLKSLRRIIHIVSRACVCVCACVCVIPLVCV